MNSYLNLKTYSIILINFFNKIIQEKLDETWESWKRSKTSWMGITWGNIEDGCMGPKPSSQNVTWSGGDMFQRLRLPRHWNICLGCLLKLEMFWWVVSFKVHVLWGAIFDWPKPALGCHRNMTCFCVDLLQGVHCPCVETCVEPPRSGWHIYNSSLK